MYARQHDTKGLEPSYRGPFKILSRPSRSTLEIKVGLTRSGEVRSEIRAWADCKPAFRRNDTIEAERPMRGRPRKNTAVDTPPDTADDASAAMPDTLEEPVTANNNTSGTDNPLQTTQPRYNLRPRKSKEVAQIDFSKPPPKRAGNSNGFSTSSDPQSVTPSAWIATKHELDAINASIVGS